MDQTDAGAKAPTIESVPMIVYSILSIKKPYDVENSLHSTHEDVRNARDFFRHTQKQKKVFERYQKTAIDSSRKEQSSVQHNDHQVASLTTRQDEQSEGPPVADVWNLVNVEG